MEISRVTALALLTRSVPPELVTEPPSATTLASVRNRTVPAMPRWVPETPSSAMVVASGLDAVVRWGELNDAVNVIEPGVSAVRRIAITWSGALANTSRR
ncbi:hypothetical protein C8D87_103340 [Lentzea atacamensis]|uniref:Uncharacterized protein n=1 Tax=Lentzea atacamensis TaxID=531938 RepID=A0ABX9EA15_9PSEU|nr:hypothetical protein C8D87_103340 [Lentzea atacamensis]